MKALVTGASRGIGEAVARELDQLGYELVLVGRARTDLEKLAGQLKSAEIHCADLSQPEQIKSLVEAVGPIQILVNNAGQAASSPIHKLSWEEWNHLLTLNAGSVMLCSQAFLPGMRAAGWGRIVNIASVAGLSGAKYISAYAASKHACIGLTRSMAAEVASWGITVNAVCPGFVATPMTEATLDRIVAQTGRSRAEAEASLTATNPQGRLIEPQEVAYAVGFLCHQRAGSINGQTLVIDGGGLLS